MANSVGNMTRLALPKGRMLAHTAELLEAVGLGFDDYTSKTRIYRMSSRTMTVAFRQDAQRKGYTGPGSHRQL